LCFFGIHPWKAHLVSSNYLNILKTFLNSTSGSLIGEIGLDKAAVAKETGECKFKEQERVFKEILSLATEMNKAVSIHCVRAFGPVFDIFRQMKDTPPVVMMHSYSGATAMAVSFLKLPNLKNKVFFSFSYVINCTKNESKTREVIKSIPDDRILIESDQNTADFIDDGMTDILEIVAQAKGWTIPQAASQLFHNSSKFFELAGLHS